MYVRIYIYVCMHAYLYRHNLTNIVYSLKHPSYIQRVGQTTRLIYAASLSLTRCSLLSLVFRCSQPPLYHIDIIVFVDISFTECRRLCLRSCPNICLSISCVQQLSRPGREIYNEQVLYYSCFLF